MLPRGLHCILCGSAFAHGEVEYTCPRCGDAGILDVDWDYDVIARSWRPSAEHSIWRYHQLLPVEERWRRPRVVVGWTPIYEVDRLAPTLGVRALRVKDDGRMPTASFKDRASAVGATRAAGLGARAIACASTGNAASSLAGMAADLGLPAVIFVPASAPEAKVAQLAIYGATVLLVEGTYADAYDLCQKSVAAFPDLYNRNCAVNPYLVEGKKTCGLEIAEQTAKRIPDVVAVSVGDGCTIAGIWKGLCEMQRLGVIDRLPRLLGVQAEGARPLVEAFERGDERIEPREARTIADSISVSHPRNAVKALRAVRASGGAMVAVPDEAILEMVPALARASGVFAEPTAAASLAGVRLARERGLVAPTDDVLAVVTGNGLKDVRGAMRASSVQPPRRIPPELDAVRRELQR
ncbi:MAG: threonine synthase [Deltaproteobacteria bacterium]|nr:threonine synthase [Deltaproteobacteria bacterium]